MSRYLSPYVKAKAVRLVRERRVDIVHSSDDLLVGRVRGDNGTYTTTIDPTGEHCTCPNGRKHEQALCSHVPALELQELLVLEYQDTEGLTASLSRTA